MHISTTLTIITWNYLQLDLNCTVNLMVTDFNAHALADVD